MAVACLLVAWFGLALLVITHLLGRKKPILIGIFTAVLVFATYSEVDYRLDEQRLSDVASDLAGVDARVHCQRLGANLVDTSTILGYVPYNADGSTTSDIYLRRETCSDLFDFLGDPSTLDPAVALAVHVLTHESMHVRGQTNEAVAECQARQRDTVSAEALGASPEVARDLVRVYTITGLPRLPDEYRTPECADGEVLDEDLPHAPWPDRDVGGQAAQGETRG